MTAKKTKTPTPRLGTLSEVRRELGRLYKEARAGRIAPSDATKFCYLLMAMRDCLVAEDLEARLSRLEDGKK